VSAHLVAAVRMRLRSYAAVPTPAALAPVAVPLAVAIAAVFMFIGLGDRPLWFDETVSVEAAKLSTGSFAHYVTAVESNMSLYYALLHVWLWLGSGDPFARALSVVFGLASLPVVYALARRLFDGATAAIAVLWLAANVNFVGHAREARGYSLELLLMTASSFFLVRAVQERRRRDWVWYVLLSALGLYAQLLAGLVVVAQLISLLVLRRIVPVRRAAVAAFAIAVLATPLAVAMIVHNQGHQIDWVTAPRPKQLPGLYYWFTESWALTALDSVACLVAIGAVYRDRRLRRPLAMLWPTLFLVALLVVPPVAGYILSWAKPVYLYRYFLVCLPALAILVAAGLVRLGRVWIVAAATAVAVGLAVHTSASCTPGCVIGTDDWRAAAGYVSANMRPGDGIVFAPAELRTPFAHFMPARMRPTLVYPLRWPLVGGAAEGAESLTPRVVHGSSPRRVWLVTWWLPTGDAPQTLERPRGVPQERDFGGNVRVRLYGPARP